MLIFIDDLLLIEYHDQKDLKYNTESTIICTQLLLENNYISKSDLSLLKDVSVVILKKMFVNTLHFCDL